MSRLAPIIGSVVCVIIAAFGISRVQKQFPSHWARMLPANAMQKADLEGAIDRIADRDGPLAGSTLSLAEFVQSNGETTRLVLVEGQFFDRSIEPQRTWRILAKNSVLVSSVDERLSNIGNLANPITAGCSIKGDTRTQALGSTTIDACQGIYKSRFNISFLARMSVIIDNPVEGKAPCWDLFGLPAGEGEYQTCVANAVGQGLNELFVAMFSLPSTDAVIVPAIATGIGKLSKSAFYNKLLTETFVPQLSGENHLPPTIYLQVWRGDPDRRWEETKKALAGAVAAAVRAWEYKPDRKIAEADWLPLTGVAFGGVFIFAAMGCGLRVGVFSDLQSIMRPLKPLIFVSWITTAVGLAAFVKLLFGLFPVQFNPYLQIIAGFFASFLCGRMVRADDSFKKQLKEGQKAAAGTPAQL